MDFDSFLERAAQQESRKAEDERYNSALTDRLMNEIAERNLPRVIDSDPTLEAQYQDELTHHFIESLENDARAAPENYPADPETRNEIIHTLARENVAHIALGQKRLLANIQILITAYDSVTESDNSTGRQQVTTAKKQLTADLLIIERYEIDDPWINFLNDVVPGDNLDSTNPQDEPYLLTAYEKLANQQEEQRQLHEKLEAAYNIAGIDFEHPTDQDVKVATTVSSMVVLGSHNSSAENASAERQARLAEVAREGGFDPEMTRRLIAYIEEIYPI